MNLGKSRMHILKGGEKLPTSARTGVSLHCHTEHSKEMLDFIPHYAAKLPVIAYFWKKERAKYQKNEGKDLDFSTAFWSPPMTSRMVYEIESRQINERGLDAIVSITDHDSIGANLQLNDGETNPRTPISLEWTVPFRYGFFHVGVHNLPRENAAELTKTLLDYTFIKENHSDERLREVFAMLNDLPGVLVILNHPLWDIEIVGKEKHEELLKDFLETHGRWIHALEVNGFRSWSENRAVIELAESIGIPLTTGGDRHGCKPNTVINLTNADTFEGFVNEIRVEKRSEIVLMPEYRQPLHSRQLQSFSEILKEYPEFPDGRKKWFDRVHFDIGDGHGPRQLSVHWVHGGPTWLRWAIWTLGVLGSPKARPMFALAQKKIDRVPATFGDTAIRHSDHEDVPKSLSSDPAV